MGDRKASEEHLSWGRRAGVAGELHRRDTANRVERDLETAWM